MNTTPTPTPENRAAALANSIHVGNKDIYARLLPLFQELAASEESRRAMLDAKGFVVVGPSDDLSEVSQFVGKLDATEKQLVTMTKERDRLRDEKWDRLTLLEKQLAETTAGYELYKREFVKHLDAIGAHFQPGGRFHKEANLVLGGDATIEGGRWLIEQLDRSRKIVDLTLRPLVANALRSSPKDMKLRLETIAEQIEHYYPTP